MVHFQQCPSNEIKALLLLRFFHCRISKCDGIHEQHDGNKTAPNCATTIVSPPAVFSVQGTQQTTYKKIRRPLPSLGPSGAAPGITAGVRLWPARTSACTAHQTSNPLPLPSQVTSAVLCQRLASRHTPFRGFQNVREARPITTQNPSVGLCRFATAFPGHREHVALQRQPFASAWPCSI